MTQNAKQSWTILSIYCFKICSILTLSKVVNWWIFCMTSSPLCRCFSLLLACPISPLNGPTHAPPLWRPPGFSKHYPHAPKTSLVFWLESIHFDTLDFQVPSSPLKLLGLWISDSYEWLEREQSREHRLDQMSGPNVWSHHLLALCFNFLIWKGK